MKKCKYEDRYNDYYKLMLKRAFHYHSICGIELTALRKLKKMLIINMEEGLIESCIKEIKQNLRSI